MILKENIKIDKLMGELINSNTLSVVDRIKLTLANAVAELYPTYSVYINEDKQGTNTPCLFVDLYKVNKRRMLGETSHYEVGFTIRYCPSDSLSDTELHNAIFKVQQHITDIIYPVKLVNSDIADRIANIKGTITVLEASIQTDPIIKSAQKGLNA